MKKDISFGDRFARLTALRGCATLTVNDLFLPVELADVLDKGERVEVTDVTWLDQGAHIRMRYELPPGELLSAVCEALVEVYDVDTVVHG